MKREEADQVIREAEAFIGIRKPVVIQSQLGLPSTLRECKFVGIEASEEKGEYLWRA